MSILTARGEFSAATLAQEVLTLPPFKAISQEDFRQLLHYLIEIEHIQQTEQGKLIIGLMGEQLVRKFNFYTVFTNNIEYVVRDESTEIGSIIMPPPRGNQFALAGRTWKVLEIDSRKKTVFVERVSGIANVSWRGGSGNIHTKILQRMKQALFENTEYPYLQTSAKQRLQVARKLSQTSGLQESNILQLEGNICCIFPWMGTVAYRTLERCLNFFVRESIDIRSIGGISPYFFTIKLGKNNLKELHDKIIYFCNKDLTGDKLIAKGEAPRLQKYDEFIPNNLLHKAFASDYLDVIELKQIIRTW
jgi:ATP-dependent Lhr-like helicase